MADQCHFTAEGPALEIMSAYFVQDLDLEKWFEEKGDLSNNRPVQGQYKMEGSDIPFSPMFLFFFLIFLTQSL